MSRSDKAVPDRAYRDEASSAGRPEPETFSAWNQTAQNLVILCAELEKKMPVRGEGPWSKGSDRDRPLASAEMRVGVNGIGG